MMLDEGSHLDARVMRQWRIQAVISALIFGALVLGAEVLARRFATVPTGVWSAVTFGVVLGLGLALAARQFEQWRYLLTPTELRVAYGVVWRKQRSIPRQRVQHVDVESGPVDRWLGLVQLTVHTAGIGAAVRIPGLTPEEATELRMELLGPR